MRQIKLGFVVCFFSFALCPNFSWGDSHEAHGPGEPQRMFPTGRQPQKITLGEVEDIILASWGVKMAARIDTGAEISSLDARDVVVEGKLVRFKLRNSSGVMVVRVPVAQWREVRTSMGVEKRPVVEVPVCLGSKLLRMLVTLRDRSEMTYPFLVGRNALNGSFVVDTSRSRAARPACPSTAFNAKQFVAASND